jgi:hypothetical protein
VLHTPVTSAPKDLAICTANVPTPPDAPMISTLCPGSIPVIAQTLQRRQRGHRYGRSLLEREVGRLQLQEVIRDGHVLSKSAKPVPKEGPEYIVTRLELRHVLADRFDLPYHVGTKDTVLRLAQPRLQARDADGLSEGANRGG